MPDSSPSPSPAPAPRSVFATKTAFAQYVLASAGVVAAFAPNAVPFVNSHPGEIMMVAALVNVAIRHFTHGKVSLFGGA